MTITQHAVSVALNGTRIEVLTGEVSIDAARAPRITAEVTVPTSELPEGLDPRYDLSWADITATAETKHELTLADLPDAGVTTIADLSTLYAGKQLRDVPYTDDSRTWRLNLRTVTEDFADDTTTLRLASCEKILQDFAMPGGVEPGWDVQWDVTLPGTSILDAVNKILEVCRLPPVTIYPSSAASTAPDVALRSWVRGVTAWDKIMQLVRTISAFAEPDEATGTLRMRSSSDRYRPPRLHVAASSGADRRLKGGSLSLDRDASDHASVIAPVSNLIPTGDTQARPLGVSAAARTVIAGELTILPMPWKVKVSPATPTSADPGYAVPAAYNVANKQALPALQRGYDLEVVMTADYTVDLLDIVDAVRPGRATRRATVEALTYSWPADELAVRGYRTLPGATQQVELEDWWIP